MDRLHLMEVFVKVAEAGSFAQAGRLMNMSPPAVTRAITALEERLGTRLMLRTTRTLRLTDAGVRFLADCRRILSEVEEAENAAAGLHAAPRGALHVTASVLFGRIYIAPILTEFLDAYPLVSAHALFVDRVVNMAEEGIDVAVRIGHLPDSSLTAIRVGAVRRVVCGAPSYFAQHGFPQTPEDLHQRRIVSFGGAAPQVEWQFGVDGQQQTLALKPALICSTNDAAIETAVRGWGVTRVLSYQIAPQVEAGALQTVLRAYEPAPWPVHIVHQDGRRASAKVRAFVDLAVERLRAHPQLQRPAVIF